VTFDTRAVATARLIAFRGTGYRHLAPRYDPCGGEGARIRGGRFNPPGSFAVLYLCLSRPCAVAEYLRYASRQTVGAEGFLPRSLYEYEVRIDRVLDLTDSSVREHVGAEERDLVGDRWEPAQRIGAAAYEAGIEAIRSPSAAGRDDVLAVFPGHLGGDCLQPRLLEIWERLDQLG
jgi:RES domain-containing protein